MNPSPTHESVVSPEGIELRFVTATASERLVALTLDLLWIFVLLFVSGLVLGLLLRGSAIGPIMLLAFALRQGWFVWHETRRNGSTPGKRRFHLRVIRADGGTLTVESLLARNLTREVELFLPLTMLLAPDVMFAGHEGPMRLVAGVWILLLLFFPLTNRHRLRIGDLLAGTRVVVSPPVPMLRDLADRRTAAKEPVEATHEFTAPQLSIYGELELQVLEDALRKSRLPGGDEVLAAVTRSIARRIGWTETVAPADRAAFLRDFYTAQRKHLEQRLLLGQRREHKRDD